MTTDAYLESEILAADPVQLISVLYRAAQDAVRTAIECLAAKDIAGRSKAITKALDIIALLTSSLDRKAGGDISHNLAGLYRYMEERLIDANLRQAEGPLNEVQNLLSTLAEAWQTVRTTPSNNRRPPVQWEDPETAGEHLAGLLYQDTAAVSSHQAWSF